MTFVRLRLLRQCPTDHWSRCITPAKFPDYLLDLLSVSPRRCRSGYFYCVRIFGRAIGQSLPLLPVTNPVLQILQEHFLRFPFPIGVHWIYRTFLVFLSCILQPVGSDDRSWQLLQLHYYSIQKSQTRISSCAFELHVIDHYGPMSFSHSGVVSLVPPFSVCTCQ